MALGDRDNSVRKRTGTVLYVRAGSSPNPYLHLNLTILLRNKMKKVRTIENDQGQKEARSLAVDTSVGFTHGHTDEAFGCVSS